MQAVASYEVNKRAVKRARELIHARRYVRDSDWGRRSPTPKRRTSSSITFVDRVLEWHLGLTEGATDETKARLPRGGVAAQGDRAGGTRAAALLDRASPK